MVIAVMLSRSCSEMKVKAAHLQHKIVPSVVGHVSDPVCGIQGPLGIIMNMRVSGSETSLSDLLS